jgi:hypothetical protein
MPDTKISALSAAAAPLAAQELPINNAGTSEKLTIGQINAFTQSTGLSVISPAQLTGDQDNYAPTGIATANLIRVSSDSGMRAITGIQAPTGTAPLRLTIANIGSFTLYFPQDHPDSSAANRFTGHSGDFKLYPGKSADIWYDLTSTKWRFLTDESESGRTGVFYEWSAGSVTAGDNNDLGVVAIGSGTNTVTTSSSTLPAFTALSTVTNAAWGYLMFFSKNAITYSYFSGAHQYVEALVSIPTLSDGTNTFTAELQLAQLPNSTTLENNNTIGIRYSDGINSGKWELFTQNGAGSETPIDLGITVAASTLYKLRIELDKSNTEARAFINNVYVGRVNATMPSAAVSGAKIIMLKSVGTAARTLNVHNFSAGAIYN